MHFFSNSVGTGSRQQDLFGDFIIMSMISCCESSLNWLNIGTSCTSSYSAIFSIPSWVIVISICDLMLSILSMKKSPKFLHNVSLVSSGYFVLLPPVVSLETKL